MIHVDSGPGGGLTASTTVNWDTLAEKVLRDESVTRAEALAVLASSDDDLLAVLAAAYRVRHRWFGREMILHVLRHAQSGSWREDCASPARSAISAQDCSGCGSASVAEAADKLKTANASVMILVLAVRTPSRIDSTATTRTSWARRCAAN